MESVQQFCKIRPIPAKPHGMEYAQVDVPARYQPSNFQAVGSCLQIEGQYLKIRTIPRHIAHPTILVKDLPHPLSQPTRVPRQSVSTLKMISTVRNSPKEWEKPGRFPNRTSRRLFLCSTSITVS